MSEHNQNGAALFLVMIVIILITAIATAALLTSKTDFAIAQNERRSVQAFYIAEAGLVYGCEILDNAAGNGFNDELAGADGTPGTSDDGLLIDKQPFGNGYFTVVVMDNEGAVTEDGDPFNDADGMVTIESTGERPLTKRILRMDVKSGQDSIPLALFGRKHFDMNGSIHIDSYDSDVEPYGHFPMRYSGDVRSNEWIDMVGVVKIYGSTYSGGIVTMTPNCFVYGEVLEHQDTINFDIDYHPCDSLCNSDLIGSPYYDASTQTFNIGGSDAISLNGTEYCFKSFTIGGRATVTFTQPKVKIYMEGNFTMNGNRCLINVKDDKPDNLRIYSKPPDWETGGRADVTLNGRSEFYGVVYCPYGDLTLNGGKCEYFGAFMCDEVTLNGNPRIHYDEALHGVLHAAGGITIFGWREKR